MALCDVPTMANSRESRSALARLYSAGMSLRAVKSPPAPKITITQGSAGLPMRLCFTSCGASVTAMIVPAQIASADRADIKLLRYAQGLGDLLVIQVVALSFA